MSSKPAHVDAQKKEVRTWIRITPADKERLNAVATNNGMESSQYLRLVLKQALTEQIVLSPNRTN